MQAREHYEALRLVRDDLPAVELVDGDARPEIQATPTTGQGFQRLRWRRFVEQTVGTAAAPPHVADLQRYLEEVKTAAARRWVTAVNTDGSHGRWRYAVAKRIADIAAILTASGN